MSGPIVLAIFFAFVLSVIVATHWRAIADKRIDQEAQFFDRDMAFERERWERRETDRRDHRMSLLEVFDKLVPVCVDLLSSKLDKPDPLTWKPGHVQYTEQDLYDTLALLESPEFDEAGALHDRAREAAIQLGQLDRYFAALRGIANRRATS